MELQIGEVIVFAGCFFGIFLRTLLPYLKKNLEAKTLSDAGLPFDNTFLATAFISGVESLIVSFLLFTNITVNLSITPLNQFISSFAFAYTSNDIINSVTT